MSLLLSGLAQDLENVSFAERKNSSIYMQAMSCWGITSPSCVQ